MRGVTRWRTLGLSVITAIVLAGCATTTPEPSALACAPDVELAILPEWAREGFSEAEPTALHALGRSGEVVAILFGGTLYSPPSPEVSNKILWVARDPAFAPGQLTIAAQRMDGSAPVGHPVERSVPDGPGPSTIDLPEAGCWRMTLSWADRTDSLDLQYVSPDGASARLASR
jgi:hypothetical protein